MNPIQLPTGDCVCRVTFQRYRPVGRFFVIDESQWRQIHEYERK